MIFKAKDIAQLIGGRVVGNEIAEVTTFSKIEEATEAKAKMRETADFKKGLQSFLDKEKLTW